MKIGHVFLDELPEQDFRRFVLLLQALAKRGTEQHAIVRDAELARRLAICDGVTVGYVVRSPLLAYCMMPAVAVAHVHGDRSAETGLLLTLTRSIPYVITHHRQRRSRNMSILRAAYRRAAAVICSTDADARSLRAFAPEPPVDVIPPIAPGAAGDPEVGCRRSASGHLRVYRRASEWQIPSLLF